MYLDLFVRPAVHTQGLHLGYVGAQFSVDRRASHTQKDTQLLRISVLRSATWDLVGGSWVTSSIGLVSPKGKDVTYTP